LNHALDLMRRLPPAQVVTNLHALIHLVPDLTEDLLQSVDQPLKIATDSEGKEYLLCDYNRDGDSYRSPWNNKYDPPISDGGCTPPMRLRELEVELNKAFSIYREQYYENSSSVSSVYLWEVDNGFAGVILFKKSAEFAKGGGQPMAGTWDAIHVFQVDEKTAFNVSYKLTSTLMITLETTSERSGTIQLSGNLTRQQFKKDVQITKDNGHTVQLGTQIETVENSMRQHVNDIYFSRTKDIVNDIRKRAGFAAFNAQVAQHTALMQAGGVGQSNLKKF